MKRAFDIAVVILFAPIWLVVFLLVSLVVLFSLGHPIFFVQERTGFRGRPFLLYKFRTMRLGEGSDASRLTRVGRFLRATSLDEIPELFQVLSGDLSLVGPRPLPVRYFARYTSEERHRHDVMPGITGLAQVSGRNALSWEEKFRYDLEYVRTHSFLLDLKILAKTGLAVIWPRGIAHAGEATMSEFKGTQHGAA